MLSARLALFVLGCWGGSALAQSSAELDAARRQAEQLQREVDQRADRQRERDARPAKPPTRFQVPVPEPVERGNGACREIREIRVDGVTLIQAKALEHLVSPYRGQCLGVTEIERLLGDLTAAYITRGYVTARVYLPQQDLSTGMLRIEVLEGAVERLIIEDGDQGSISPFNVAPGVIGKPLNLRDLEQALDQINRLASNDAQLDIAPGTAPGDSMVILSNAPSRTAHFNLTYDNHGLEATGREQVGATVGLDNPLGLNDFLSFTHRRSFPYSPGVQAARSNSLFYAVPFGYSTVSLSASESDYASLLDAPSGTKLRTRGDSESISLRLDHVAWRGQRSQWNVSAMLTGKESKSFLEDILLEVSSRRLTVFDLDSSFTTSFMGGVVTLDAGMARGTTLFGALQDDANLPEDVPQAQFTKLKFGGSYFLTFKAADKDWSFSSRLTGQHGLDTLYGSEQISIGGIYSVRGFVDNVLAGDHGYFVRNDLSLHQPFVALQGTSAVLRPYVGLDYGKVWNRASQVPEGELTGMAFGAALSLGSVSLDVFHARPVNQPGFMSREGDSTFFNLSAAF
jgi:hemolysin activation/secretion protein